jgi:hypothetical protein
MKMEKEIMKKIRREILKAAKRDELFFYWDVTGLPKEVVGNIMVELEKEGKVIKSKGTNYKIIMW